MNKDILSLTLHHQTVSCDRKLVPVVEKRRRTRRRCGEENRLEKCLGKRKKGGDMME
ncbi:hypothetical protein INR49_019974 [Caranx melampygus]|nr:hypothetical protein INR49_019974 [Caranx melampygus]